MNFTCLKYELTQWVATITLNRPEVLNSINAKLAEELIAALDDIQKNVQVRAALLTGEGRGFCAGQDLSEVAKNGQLLPLDLGTIVEERYNRIVRLIRHTEKPFVCAVTGAAAGAGANIALACDFVLAATDAMFIQSFSKVGLAPDSGGTFILPRLVGLARATELLMLGEKLSAKEAERIGMIHRVIPPDELLGEARALAAYLARQATMSLGLIKRALNKSLACDLDTQLNLERDLQALAGRSADYHEGVLAFLEKRAPSFQGR